MDFGMKTLTVLHHPPAAQLGHVFHRCGMRLNYFWPNVIIYNSGSNACEKGAQWHHAHGSSTRNATLLVGVRHNYLLLDVIRGKAWGEGTGKGPFKGHEHMFFVLFFFAALKDGQT